MAYQDQTTRNNYNIDQLLGQHKNGQTRGDLAAPDVNDIRHNYNTYRYDYFSGAQAKVFFGDIFVDDIVTISYATRQTKEPIYGYASQNYDAVAMGTFIGEGSLTIAFKEVGYLNVIKSYLDHQREGIDNARRNVASRLRSGKETNISNEMSNTHNLAVSMAPNLTPSLVRRGENIETVLDNLKDKNLSPFDYRTEGTLGNASKDFDDMAELLEDTIWGDHNGTPFELKNNELKRVDEFDYMYNRGEAVGIIAGDKNKYRDTLNILLTFGDINDYKAEHTIILLNDVHFNSSSMVVAPTGEPIGETYNFFFRDINKSLSSAAFNINGIKLNIGTDETITLPRKQDMETLSLLMEGGENEYILSVISMFNGSWTVDGIPKLFEGDPPYSFNRRYDIPFSDQLTKFVEDLVSDKMLGTTNLPDKILVKVEPVGAGSNTIINFILAKGSDFTSIYKVEVPSRNDFYAVNLVQREDFFYKPLPPEPLLSPLNKDGYVKAIDKEAKANGTYITSSGEYTDAQKQQIINELNLNANNRLEDRKKDIANTYPPITKEELEDKDYLERMALENQRAINIQTSEKSAVIGTQAELELSKNKLQSDILQQQDIYKTTGQDIKNNRLDELKIIAEKEAWDALDTGVPFDVQQNTLKNQQDLQRINQELYNAENELYNLEYNNTPKGGTTQYYDSYGNAQGFIPTTRQQLQQRGAYSEKSLKDTATNFGDIALRESARTGIPPELLLSIVHQESRGNIEAVGPKVTQKSGKVVQAHGPYQILGETGTQYGLKTYPSNKEPGTEAYRREVYQEWHDPNKAGAAAADYLAKIGSKPYIDKYKYTNPKAYQQLISAAYFAGENNKDIKQGQIPNATYNPKSSEYAAETQLWRDWFIQQGY